MKNNSTDPFIEVIVIGAGPSGLAVAACLQRAKIPFLMLEEASEVGSRWRLHYDRLHLHTIKRFSALPYLPFPADYPTYPSRQQFHDYLAAYAKHFQLEPRFNQTVTAIQRVDENWEVHTTNALYRSRFVVMATGFNRIPYSPHWPDQDLFQGKIIHSSLYKNGETFRDKKVLVVGFGNSGSEIVIDLWEHGAIPSVAVRHPVNVVPRDLLFGLPAQYTSILLSKLPARLADQIVSPMIWLKFGNLSQYGLEKHPYGPMRQIKERSQVPVIDIGAMKLIRQGLVKVRSDVEKFTETGVIFTDGLEYPFDAVILATGYRPQLESLLATQYPVLNERGYPLQSGQATAAPGLYFCGFRNSVGGLLHLIASESKKITQDIVQRRLSSPPHPLSTS